MWFIGVVIEQNPPGAGDNSLEPGATPDVRASDRERDAVSERLSEHASQGRLTLAEFEERMTAAQEAVTRGELAALMKDLPNVATRSSAAPVDGRRIPVTRWIVGIMGGSTKKGRWRPARRTNVLALMGGHDIDLRNAELDFDELVLNVYNIMGGTDVYVPDTVDLHITGFSLMGGTDENGSTRQPRPGAPRITVRMINVMGGGDVWRLPEETNGMSLKKARKHAKQL